LLDLAHRCSAAKYAAAFERKSFFIRSSRFSRSSSRSRARSVSCNGGSSSACFSRYARTQFPKEVSLIESSRATSAIGREVSTTIRAASSPNSGEYVLYFPPLDSVPSGADPKGSAVRKPRGTLDGGAVEQPVEPSCTRA